MLEFQARKRRGVTLIELLVVVAIIGVLVALSVTGVQKARTAAARAESVNNLRQIGLAVQSFQNRNGAYPTEASQNGQAPSFYRSVLPDLEQTNLTGVTPATAPSVRTFLCTARRGPEVGAKRDFGYASSLAIDNQGPSILDSGPVRPSDVTRGAANVYLLTSLWMAPANYSGGDPTDLGWLQKLNARMYGGTIFADSDPDGSDVYLGGPFADSLPHLFADGHVAGQSYAGYTNQWSYLADGSPNPVAATPGSTPTNPLMPDSGSSLDGYCFTVTPDAAADSQAISEAENYWFNGGPDMSDKAASAQFQSLLSNPTKENITAALNMLKQGGLCSLDMRPDIMSSLNQALNSYRTNPSSQNTANLVAQLQNFTPYDAGNGKYVWIDPEIATGYNYTSSGNNFRAVMLPKPLPRGQKLFELVVNGQAFPLEAGKPFDFTQVSADGVAAFTIRGINVQEKLDPTNVTAFVTGVRFMSKGTAADVMMLPRTVRSGVPVWLWVLLGTIALCVGGFIVWARRRAEGAASSR